MTEKTSPLLLGMVLGALVMFLLINFASNNLLFGTMMSSNTCSLMHGGSASTFPHAGFWVTLLVLVVVIVLAYPAIIATGRPRRG